MVFKDYDAESGELIPFIWECDMGQNYRDGARVMKLSEKLKKKEI